MHLWKWILFWSDAKKCSVSPWNDDKYKLWRGRVLTYMHTRKSVCWYYWKYKKECVLILLWIQMLRHVIRGDLMARYPPQGSRQNQTPFWLLAECTAPVRKFTRGKFKKIAKKKYANKQKIGIFQQLGVSTSDQSLEVWFRFRTRWIRSECG